MERRAFSAGVPNKTKIGVFDSGVGGLSVVNAIKKELPELEIIYKEDREHVPYGTRNIDEIYGFVKPIFQEFINERCQVVVVACNTVTTNLISRLRDEFSVPMVGMEPMVKPAAVASKTGVITVCATPRTLESQRYHWLKEQFAKNVKVLEPDCSDWAYMVEHNRVNRQKIAKIVEGSITQGADQIVLGCTHYHWIEELIKQMVNDRAQIIQPEGPVIKQLKRVLGQLV
ncbi:MAG TPA: glutamate racemase [Candidatus Saccharimonadales bacterium]